MAGDITLPSPPRRTQDRAVLARAIVYGIALVPFILLGGLAVAWREEVAFNERAVRTTATVREWSVGRDGQNRLPHYRFEAQGRTFRGKHAVPQASFGSVPEGGPWPVWYEPGRPERNRIAPVPALPPGFQLAAVAVGGGFVGLFAGCGLWLRAKYARLRRLARLGCLVTGRVSFVGPPVPLVAGWNVRVEYDTADGTVREVEVACDASAMPRAGDAVPILVDPDRPGDAISLWQVTHPGAGVRIDGV